VLVSEEQGAQHGAYLFEDDWRCETNRGGQSWRNLAVVLPKFGSTTDENPEGIRTRLHTRPRFKIKTKSPFKSAAYAPAHAFK
jgi:hypothetical protein